LSLQRGTEICAFPGKSALVPEYACQPVNLPIISVDQRFISQMKDKKKPAPKGTGFRGGLLLMREVAVSV
jgi:hypothetical protein